MWWVRLSPRVCTLWVKLTASLAARAPVDSVELRVDAGVLGFHRVDHGHVV
jgi:hypothetical protein